MKGYFVTGIGTGVGKTVVSAICSEALGAYYWKPVQAGDLNATDSLWVQEHTRSVSVLPERFCLSQPMSPHAAADIDGIQIHMSDFKLPDTGNRPLIVEGAGGLLVPLSTEVTMLDLIQHLALPVIVVAKNYLGSINHTLLTLKVLKFAAVEVAGIIYSGDENKASQEAIVSLAQVPCLGMVPQCKNIGPEFILEQAEKLKSSL